MTSLSRDLMTRFYQKFREFTMSGEMFSERDRVLLSLSAGKDSMFLLHMMTLLARELQLELGIFHLNHMTREGESDQDQIFLESVADRAAIPVYSEKYNFDSAVNKGKSFEERARDVRYSLLEEICLKYNYNKIATAHNCDDNAETVLMRIFSGTGIYGLRGISCRRNNIFRPILSFSAEDIYSFLRENDIKWREDMSNQSVDYQRNYIRNILWPLIVSRFPDALGNITNLSAHADENTGMIESFIHSLAGEYAYFDGTKLIIDSAKFGNNIKALKFALARQLGDHFNFRLSVSLFDEILKRSTSAKSNIILYENSDILIERKFIEDRNMICAYKKSDKAESPQNYQCTLPADDYGSVYIPEIESKIVFERLNTYVEGELKSDQNRVYIALPENDCDIVIRNRRPGDRIILEAGAKKIKNLMIEKKLDSDTKKRVPLIVIDGAVAAYLAGAVFAGSNRVSRNFWVTKDTKKMIVIYVPQS